MWLAIKTGKFVSMARVFYRVICVIVTVSGFGQATFAAQCNEGASICWGTGIDRSSSSPKAQPSTSSKVSVNPSSVPLENGMGGELLFFTGSPDLILVKGNGRVGAGVSLSNGEETFFGPPGFELSSDFLSRHIAKKKYESQKITLATAIAAINNKKTGLKAFQINFGLVGKYNKKTSSVWPGAGVSMVAGPLTIGFASTQDEYQLDLSSIGQSTTQNYPYSTDTFSLGIYLSSFILDYSVLRVYAQNATGVTFGLLTGTFLYKKLMLTAASRVEVSARPEYDYSTKTLVTNPVKYESFLGVQYSINRNFMLSVFHNYYLMKELSLGVTLFF